MFSAVVGGFESSSSLSSCFSTAGDSLAAAVSALCGVASGAASLLLDRLAVAPALPPPRPTRDVFPPLGGIVREIGLLFVADRFVG